MIAQHCIQSLNIGISGVLRFTSCVCFQLFRVLSILVLGFSVLFQFQYQKLCSICSLLQLASSREVSWSGRAPTAYINVCEHSRFSSIECIFGLLEITFWLLGIVFRPSLVSSHFTFFPIVFSRICRDGGFRFPCMAEILYSNLGFHSSNISSFCTMLFHASSLLIFSVWCCSILFPFFGFSLETVLCLYHLCGNWSNSLPVISKSPMIPITFHFSFV